MRCNYDGGVELKMEISKELNFNITVTEEEAKALVSEIEKAYKNDHSCKNLLLIKDFIVLSLVNK